MTRSVLVRSDRNIQDHLWKWFTLTGWTDIFDKMVHCSTLLSTGRFHFCREFGKGIKNGKILSGVIRKC